MMEVHSLQIGVGIGLESLRLEMVLLVGSGGECSGGYDGSGFRGSEPLCSPLEVLFVEDVLALTRWFWRYPLIRLVFWVVQR